MFHLQSLALSALFILVAHTASNVVYTIANYSITRCFDSSTIAMAAARNYQLGILSLVMTSSVASLLTAQFGLNGALGLSVFGLITYLFVFRKWRP